MLNINFSSKLREAENNLYNNLLSSIAGEVQISVSKFYLKKIKKESTRKNNQI